MSYRAKGKQYVIVPIGGQGCRPSWWPSRSIDPVIHAGRAFWMYVRPAHHFFPPRRSTIKK
jgi:hypothetical protein